MPFSNVTATAAAATAVTATLPAAAGETRVIQSVIVSCSGAATGAITLTINDSGSPVFVADLSLAIGVPYVLSLPAGGLAIGLGDASTVVTSAGASSSVVKVNVGFVDA